MTLSVIMYGQTLIVQSNNADDLKQYQLLAKKTDISSIQTKLENVIKSNPDYGNSKIKIQITFFDPSTLGGLKLKSNHTHSSDYVNVWKNTYTNEDRILFLFEKQGGKYQLKDFAVSQSIEDGQIPNIVATYIKEHILTAQKDNPEVAVYKGLNAIKNAYDRRFQQKLIEHAPKMLTCRYFYKGYTCISTDTYYFQNEITEKTQSLSLPIMYLDNQGKYQDVYLKNWNNVKAAVFDRLLGHELTTNIGSTAQSNFFIIDGSYKNIDYLNFTFDTKDLFDYSSTDYSSFEEVASKSAFSFVDELQSSKIILTPDFSAHKKTTPLQVDGKNVPVSHNTLYKLVKKTIQGPDWTNNLYNGIDDARADSISKEMIWGSVAYQNKYPTWCNVYAQYLSRHIYGIVNGDFLAPSNKGNMNANAMFNFFNSSPHHLELNKKESGTIWTKYIDKGYPVYFSALGVISNGSRGSGHIETGFPTNSNVNKYNKTAFSGTESTTRSLSDNQFVVGAGSTVGFKSYVGSSWLKKEETKAFLALQYLSNEYE